MKQSKLMERIEKVFKESPELRILPMDRKRDGKKAKLMQWLLEQTWEENWPYVKQDIEARIKVMIQKCYMVGQHNWIGYGQKGRHVCKRCGLKAGVAYDPIFTGIQHISWDSPPNKE